MESEIINYLVERTALKAGTDRDDSRDFPEYDLAWEAGEYAGLLPKASLSMRENGCVILRNFLNSEEAGRLRESIEELLSSEEIAQRIATREDLKTTDYLLNCTFKMCLVARKRLQVRCSALENRASMFAQPRSAPLATTA